MLVAFSIEGEDLGETPGAGYGNGNSTLDDPMGDQSRDASFFRPMDKCHLRTWLNRKTYDVFYPRGQKSYAGHIMNPQNFWEVPYTNEKEFTCCANLGAAPPTGVFPNCPSADYYNI